MKIKNYIAIALLISSYWCEAQNSVGINTPVNDASAVFEITSTNKGILIPRMSSGQKNSISNPANGLIIFDNNTRSFWFYSNSAWTEIIGNGSIPDGLGDADADTRIFLEYTNDNDQVRFYQGGTEYFRMRRHRFDVVNNGGSVFFGLGAGQNDDQVTNYNVFVGENAGNAMTTGRRNVGVGYNALSNQFRQHDNVAVGFNAANAFEDVRRTIAVGSNAMSSVDSVDFNIALGHNALINHEERNYNIAVGAFTLGNSINARNNVALGTGALSSMVSGGFNVAIGHRAGESSVGNNYCVYLGHMAGANNTSGRRMFIDNSATATPLIWGDFSVDSIVINGSILITSNLTYGGNITDVSDRRLKTKIKKEKNILPKLVQLQGYRYTKNINGIATREYGLVAQEVENVFPKLVRRFNPNNDYIGISYTQFIPLILEAEKEQWAQLQNLGDRIDEHNNELDTVSEELSLLKERLRAQAGVK